MKFNTIQKCQLVGYLFLIAITIVEIILLCNILGVSATGRIIATIAMVSIFNFSIWSFALKYQIIKRILDKND